MTIGALYDANNIVVGQAAVLIAPVNTPLPDFATLNMADPFDPTGYVAYTLTAPATSTFTLTIGGVLTSALSNTSTGAAILAAIQALPAVAAVAAVGGSIPTVTPSTNPGPFTIVLPEELDDTMTLQVTTGTPTLTGGLWTPVGATDQGWKFNTNKSTTQISIEEQSTPVSQAISSQNVTIEGSLSEDISRTLAIAWNAFLTQTAQTSLEPAYDTLSLTDTVLYYAVAMVTNHYNGFPRVTYAPKWAQLSNVSTDFRRAAGKRMYPVSFETLCKPAQIQTFNFTHLHN